NHVVDISGWQLKASTTNAESVITLLVVLNPNTLLQPGQHLLATNSSPNGYGGTTAPNVTYTGDLSDNGGLALTLPNDAVVDSVGLSARTAFREGQPLAPLGSNSDRSYERLPGGTLGSCQDTNNNAVDFQSIAPAAPQNLFSPFTVC